MAQISLNLEGEQDFGNQMVQEGECLGVNLHTEVETSFGKHTYTRDWVTLHGSIADMRRFANGILAALPAETTVEPTAEMLTEAQA